MPGPDPEEQRRLQEIEAARTSELFFSAGMQTAAPGISLAGHTAGGLIGQQGLGGATSTAAQDRHAGFLNGPVDRRPVSSDQPAPPASPYALPAGAVLPAALLTALRPDLPGPTPPQGATP